MAVAKVKGVGLEACLDCALSRLNQLKTMLNFAEQNDQTVSVSLLSGTSFPLFVSCWIRRTYWTPSDHSGTEAPVHEMAS
jgi:hypothetical protein